MSYRVVVTLFLASAIAGCLSTTSSSSDTGNIGDQGASDDMSSSDSGPVDTTKDASSEDANNPTVPDVVSEDGSTDDVQLVDIPGQEDVEGDTSPAPDTTGPQPADVQEDVMPEEDVQGDPNGTYILTFQVLMEPGYAGGVTIGNSVQGWNTAGMVQLSDPDGDSIFVGEMELKAGTKIEYKFIKGYDGGGVWEDVPVDCGLQTGEYINRFFTMPAKNVVLEVTPYSGCPGDTPNEGVCGNKPGRDVAVTTAGAKLLMGGTPYHMKGVAWSPMPKGQAPGAGGADFAGTVDEDAQLMADAGINVVRTYGPILDKVVLDKLWAKGITVLMTVYYGFGDTPDSAVANVCAVKSHPAILGWVVGNEWNYTNLHKDISFDQAVNEVKAVAAAIQLNDSSRPVSTVYGGLPPANVYQKLSNIDLWGSNHYPGLSFGNFFNDWKALSPKPLYFGEYGADAYDGTKGQVDEQTQADIVAGLTEEIHANASVNGSGVCAGGIVFEFNDEWWKKDGGSWTEHDTDASWQNGGYPDPNMNEEWWGLVDIDRNPRKAYEAYKALAAPTP